MVADYVRFNRAARALLVDPDDGPLAAARFLDDEGFSRLVRRPPARPPGRRGVVGRPRADVVVPGALPRRSSSPTTGCCRSPGARSGRRSRAARARYVEALTAPFADRIRVAHAGRRRRLATPTHVDVVPDGGRAEQFDEVVIAAHADQALALLDRSERPPSAEVLGAFPYQPNEAVLHTDARCCRAGARAWAAGTTTCPPSRAAAAP